MLLNFKIASGLFEQDRYLPLIQGGINLVVSIVLVQKMGVAGVYVGTLVSGILANLIRPVIIYRVCFDRKAWPYFMDSLKYIAAVLLVALVMIPVRNVVMGQVTIVTFAAMVLLVTVMYNAVFLLAFHRTEEFSYLWNVVVQKIPGFRR